MAIPILRTQALASQLHESMRIEYASRDPTPSSDMRNLLSSRNEDVLYTSHTRCSNASHPVSTSISITQTPSQNSRQGTRPRRDSTTVLGPTSRVNYLPFLQRSGDWIGARSTRLPLPLQSAEHSPTPPRVKQAAFLSMYFGRAENASRCLCCSIVRRRDGIKDLSLKGVLSTQTERGSCLCGVWGAEVLCMCCSVRLVKRCGSLTERVEEKTDGELRGACWSSLLRVLSKPDAVLRRLYCWSLEH